MAYKRRFSDKDAELREQDAKAAEKITAAERKMAFETNATNNYNNRIADLTNDAHARRMQSRANFIESNQNAVSPWERSAVLGRRQRLQDEGQLRAHEMDMLKQRGENDKAVAHEKRMGLENQGLAVGKLRYGETDFEGNRTKGSDEIIEEMRGKNALSLAEKEGANKKELADIGLKQSELEWGRSNPDGTRTVGGRESVAQAEGKARVDAAKAQAEAAAQEAATKRALEEQKIRAAQEKEKARLKLSYDRLDAKTKNDIDAAAARIEKEQGIGHEDAISQVMAGREQSGQQGGGEAWPGYTAEKTAELKKRGYTLVNGKPVKNG